MRNVYAYKSTVAGGEMVVSSGPAKFGGFILNGSSASTIIIKDGTTTILTTSAAANVYIKSVLEVPIACTTSLLSTCSGNGFYSVFLTT